ncbi:MAG: hypothetical protein HQK51_00180 [Oligoflexia bacterium]|nr:hypothetical protein [Oligoflexia bacterium]
MFKRISFLFFLSFFMLTMFAGCGDGLYKEETVAGNNVYVGGFSINVSDVKVPGYWKNKVWNSLTPIDVARNSQVNSIFVTTDSRVYAGGYSTSTTSIMTPGYWFNGTWTALVPGVTTKDAAVSSMFVDSNGKIYAAGYTTSAIDKKVPGYWLDGVWTALTTLEGKNSEVYSLTVAGGNVYAVGYDTKTVSGADVKVPTYWYNGTRTELARIYTDKVGEAFGVSIAGGEVYIAGYNVDTATNVKTPCYWKNNVLTQLTNGLSSTKDAYAKAITVANGHIYVAGYGLSSGVNDASTNRPFVWTDGVWLEYSRIQSTTSGGLNHTYGVAIDVTSEGRVYVAGYSDLYAGFWRDSLLETLPPLYTTKAAQALSIFITAN